MKFMKYFLLFIALQYNQTLNIPLNRRVVGIMRTAYIYNHKKGASILRLHLCLFFTY